MMQNIDFYGNSNMLILKRKISLEKYHFQYFNTITQSSQVVCDF